MGGTLCGARRYRDHRARAETLVGRTEAAAHEDNAASRAAATRQSGQLAAQAFECPLVRPEVVVEVTYLTRTDDNLLRQFAIRGSARGQACEAGGTGDPIYGLAPWDSGRSGDY